MDIEDGNKKKDPTKDFELVEKLGSGSYGVVWKALYRKTGTITAVKIVPVENDIDDIINEIKIMKSCKSPYIISYYGSYFRDNELWIVMELCGAGSISDLMKVTDKTLTEEQIAVVLKDALKGLSYLHSMRKIHRDIKAGNILMNDKGEGKLADFGVSGQLSDTMAKRNTVIGTPFWMAPEVIQEVGYDVKADIWSLGITAIEMADGRPPHSNIHPMRAIFMIPSKPPPKPEHPEKWGKDFMDFLTLSLMKNPDQRPMAAELSKHPFVTKTKTAAVILTLIQESEEIIRRVGREEALGLEEESDDEESETDTKNSTKRSIGSSSGTMISSSSDYGSTMVISDNSGTMKTNPGTMKVKSDDSYVPQFMSFVNKDKAPEPAPTLSHTAEPLNPKYNGVSTDDLKKQLRELTARADSEIEAVKAKYAKQKTDIEAALKLKKKR